MNIKRLLLQFSTIISLSFTFFSCGKVQDWDCKCTYMQDGVQKEMVNPIHDRTKKEAKEICNPGFLNARNATEIECKIEE